MIDDGPEHVGYPKGTDHHLLYDDDLCEQDRIVTLDCLSLSTLDDNKTERTKTTRNNEYNLHGDL